jgi:hypothetical protein
MKNCQELQTMPTCVRAFDGQTIHTRGEGALTEAKANSLGTEYHFSMASHDIVQLHPQHPGENFRMFNTAW